MNNLGKKIRDIRKAKKITLVETIYVFAAAEKNIKSVASKKVKSVMLLIMAPR